MKQAELVYTQNEEAAVEILKANRGTPLSAKKLGTRRSHLYCS